jgi:hypothetical protein
MKHVKPFEQFIGEALITEGQFSWMTQDTGNQIGSEKENTITVTMFDNKGNKWTEKKYDGYGEFGGKDYYELLAQMNGIEKPNRQDGIDLAFGKQRIKGKVLFPALIEDPRRFNYKKHDFTQEAPNDPNQSWYQEPEEDDYNESVVTESHFQVGDKVKCISSGMTGEVISLDDPAETPDAKYYNVKREDGKMIKYAPDELALTEAVTPEPGSDEIQMALGELERIGDYAGMISDRIKSMPDLESWVQSKITKAKDYLTSVHDYLDGIDGDTQDDI